MSVSIKMSARDKASFNKDIKRYAKKLETSRDKALDTLALNIRNQAINILDKNGTNNVGQLRTSISITKTISGGRRVGTATGYGLYVEFGRRPGRMPNTADIERWVRRKLKVKKKDAPNAAFNIARKIAREGTKAQPFLRPAFEREKRKMILEIRKAIK